MIECSHVYKRYKNGTNALYDLNFSVDQGEFVYIIGPTGSGKSTLIKLLDAEETVRRLKTEALQDQWTFHTDKILSFLTFIEAREIREEA